MERKTMSSYERGFLGVVDNEKAMIMRVLVCGDREWSDVLPLASDS